MSEVPHPFSAVELWIQAAMRVPPYPQPPEGSPDSIQVFNPGRNYYKLCLLGWFLAHVLALTVLIAAYLLVSRALLNVPEWAMLLVRGLEWLAMLAFATSAIFTFFAQRLNYALRWYIVTDRSLRIRTGVFSMQELTMTFSNIQEIRVAAGPIQNFLKLANVEVQSAGGGAKGGEGHIGSFKGVSNANEIRDLMVERLRQYRDSGLGEAAIPKGVYSEGTAVAARAVLEEVCKLRVHVTSAG